MKRFSIIELILVIFILLLVLTFLFSSISQAKQQTKKVVCANNLRQLSMGYTFFAKASETEFPPFAWIMQPNLNNPNNDKVFGGHPPQGRGGGLNSKLAGGAWLDESMATLMTCPADDDPELRVYSSQINPDFTGNDFSNATSYNQTRTIGNGLVEVESSYGYNLNLGLYKVKMMSIPIPSEMLVNFDADSLFSDGFKQNGASKLSSLDLGDFVTDVLEPRHLEKANLLFADGHVSQGTNQHITIDNLYTSGWQTTGNGYYD